MYGSIFGFLLKQILLLKTSFFYSSKRDIWYKDTAMKLLLSCLVVVVIVGVSSSDKLENNELSVRLNTTDKVGIHL